MSNTNAVIGELYGHVDSITSRFFAKDSWL